MNREEIIRMARKAAEGMEGFTPKVKDPSGAVLEFYERFAALVASAERDKHKWDIHSCSPTCNRYACVATREAVLAEREACAKVCEEMRAYVGINNAVTQSSAKDCAAAIRARGQA